MGWRRTARLKEPQKLGPKQAPTHRPNLSPMLSPKNSTAQSSPQFSAPCPPHCGSAFAPPLFRAPLTTGGYCARAARAPRPVDGQNFVLLRQPLPPFFARATPRGPATGKWQLPPTYAQHKSPTAPSGQYHGAESPEKPSEPHCSRTKFPPSEDRSSSGKNTPNPAPHPTTTGSPAATSPLRPSSP